MFNLSLFKSSLFKKYFVSYLGLFVFAFILFGLYIYNTTIRELRSDIDEANSGQLSQIELVVTDNLRDIRTLADRMGMDSELIPYKVRNSQYTNNTTNQLKLYKNSHSWVDEVFVYYGDPMIQSSEGTLSTTTLASFSPYFDELFSQESDERDTFFGEQVKTINYRQRAGENTNNKFIYTAPMSKGALQPHATAFFVLDMEEVVKMLDGIPNSASFILNENGTPITHSVSFSASEVYKLSNLIKENPLSSELNHEDTDYRVTTASANHFDWEYVSLTKTNLFYENITKAYWSLFLFLATSILLGSVLSLLIALYQYQPLNRLLNYLTTQHNNGLGSIVNKGNEIEYLNDLISDVIDENKTMQNELVANKPLVRNHLFMQLLEGNIDNERMDTLLEKNDLELSGDQYFVSTIDMRNQTKKQETIELLQDLLEKYSDLALNGSVVNGIYLDYKDQMVFVVSLDSVISGQLNEKSQKEILDSIIDDFNSVFEENYCMGVGMIYGSLSKIKQSYIESITASDYSFQNPSKNQVYFKNIYLPQSNDFSTSYKKDILLLEQSLKEGEKEVAKDALEGLRSYLKMKPLTIAESKFITFEIVQVIIHAAVENNVPKVKETIDDIMSTQSIDECLPILDYYIIEISSEIEKEKQTNQDTIVNEMMHYIEQNYLSSSLSLESIASKFNFSVSYTSRLIKEYQDVSFSQYLQELRMNEFKRRLINTNDTIKNLVIEVGYMDVSNFTRKFKAKNGITPSEYRKQNK